MQYFMRNHILPADLHFPTHTHTNTHTHTPKPKATAIGKCLLSNHQSKEGSLEPQRTANRRGLCSPGKDSVEGNPLQAVWCVKNAASFSQLLFLVRQAEFKSTGKLEGRKGCLLRKPSSPSFHAPPTPLLRLPSPQLQWAGGAFPISSSIHSGGEGGRGKTKL